LPTFTANIFTLQRGHDAAEISTASSRDGLAPHHGQCFIPANIEPKQAGHDTLARKTPHHSQVTLSGLASPPHPGHFIESSDIRAVIDRAFSR
jgi:hypothetical protein